MQQSNQHADVIGFTQTPLMDAGQLIPGTHFTGIVMSHIWQVIACNGVTLQFTRLPMVTPSCDPATPHTLVAYGRGQQCSRCGLRELAVAEFLPKREDKPRAFVLSPTHPLHAVKPFTLYAAMVGGSPSFHMARASGVTPVEGRALLSWDAPLPIFPRLIKVWELPPALQALMSTGIAL
jgi:hypothetical protein